MKSFPIFILALLFCSFNVFAQNEQYPNCSDLFVTQWARKLKTKLILYIRYICEKPLISKHTFEPENCQKNNTYLGTYQKFLLIDVKSEVLRNWRCWMCWKSYMVYIKALLLYFWKTFLHSSWIECIFWIIWIWSVLLGIHWLVEKS